MPRIGDPCTLTCFNCGTTLETTWEPRSEDVADGLPLVLEARASCPRCPVERVETDAETLGARQHVQLVHAFCAALEASGAWIFTDEDRQELEDAPIRLTMGDWEDVEAFIRQYANERPRRLLCFHTGFHWDGAEAPENYADVLLFVPGRPGPAFVPLVVVMTETARCHLNRENRIVAPKLGFKPVFLQRVDLDEHLVSVRMPGAGLLTEHAVEVGVRRFLRELVPPLAHLPIQWLPYAKT